MLAISIQIDHHGYGLDLRYKVDSIDSNGSAILKILKDESIERIKRMMDNTKDAPEKKYRSTYNSKHGRIW